MAKMKNLEKKTTDTEAIKQIIESIGSEYELLLVSAVVGWGWNKGDSIWGMIKPDKKLRLVREAFNTHDSRAVAVFFSNTKIGYIPKKDNKAIADLMDAGKANLLHARVLVAEKSDNSVSPVTFYIYKNKE